MTYPALVPSARTYTPGDIPQSSQTALSGARTGFRRGNRRQDQTLSLTYNNLTEAQLDLIKAHYISTNGTFDFFYLNAEVWSGYSSPPVSLLSDYAWRYAGPPTISDGIVGRWAVEVELRTYAIDPSDLIIDGGPADGTTPTRSFIIDGGPAALTPTRTHLIDPGGAA